MQQNPRDGYAKFERPSEAWANTQMHGSNASRAQVLCWNNCWELLNVRQKGQKSEKLTWNKIVVSKLADEEAQAEHDK